MYFYKTFGFLCLLTVMTGCSGSDMPAPEVAKDQQIISIHTPGVMGANCFAAVNGLSYPVSTPGKISVTPSNDPIDVTCFKGEHMVGNERITPACVNCVYPASISVAMRLDDASMYTSVRQVR